MSNEIELIPIRTSQQIQAAGYGVSTQTLRVQRGREIWEYPEVAPRVSADCCAEMLDELDQLLATLKPPPLCVGSLS